MNANGDKFNPFKAMAENAKMREKLVNEFADFLVLRARAIVNEGGEHSKLFQIQDNSDWLMDQIEDLAEQDELSEKDAARLSAMYFYLLTSGTETQG